MGLLKIVCYVIDYSIPSISEIGDPYEKEITTVGVCALATWSAETNATRVGQLSARSYYYIL